MIKFDFEGLGLTGQMICQYAIVVVIKIIVALVIYIVGGFVIRRLIKLMSEMKAFRNMDATASGYILTFLKAALYIALAVSIVALLGVPMSSVIALIASVGVAVGMAMQGSLANIAGGIMLLIFRPFNVGDYISTGAEEGTVRSVSLVYTVLTTYDNRRIFVPNGSLMNANIFNATAETLRRVDLSFDIADSEPVDRVIDVITETARSSEYALEKPELQVLPTAPVTDGLTYAVRVWTNTKDYWKLHGELMVRIPTALNDAGIARPETPVRVRGK